jgi:NADH:ubiquinone oxidoreductase subunit 3 (subunit A)
MIAIALIVGIVIVLVVVQKVIGSTINSADRAIRRETYESGKAEAATELVI